MKSLLNYLIIFVWLLLPISAHTQPIGGGPIGPGTGYTPGGTDVPVTDGGTGVSTLTDGGILLGSGTEAITALGVATNGQIPIGDGTTDPVLATITGTANEVTVVNGAGTITLSIPDSPILVTPALGTIASGVGTALTALNGENIQDDTIDDDSIDFSDITFADFDYETAWKMWYSNADGDVTEITLGDDGTFLESNGASVAPVFRALESGDIPDISATYQPLDTELTAIAALPLISGLKSWEVTTNANPYTLVAATDGYMINVTTITAHEDDLVLTIGETSTLANQFWYIGNVAANTLILSDSPAVVEVQGYIELEINNWVLLKRSVANDRWEVMGSAVTTLFLASLDMSSGTITIPTTTSGDQTLTVGQIGIKTDEDYLVTHGGANGQVTTEVAVPLFIDKEWSFDPDAICDLTTDRLFLMTVDHTHGITILEWELSFDVDPTTEFGADHVMLKRADAWIGVANAANMDALDTTNGVASESTIANINAGAVIADGQKIYLQFDTAYTEALHQCYFRLRYKVEED